MVGKGNNPHEALFNLYVQTNPYFIKTSSLTNNKITGLYKVYKEYVFNLEKIYPVTIIALKPSSSRLWIGLYEEPNQLYPNKDCSQKNIDEHFFTLLANKEDCLQYYLQDVFSLGKTPHEVIQYMTKKII